MEYRRQRDETRAADLTKLAAKSAELSLWAPLVQPRGFSCRLSPAQIELDSKNQSLPKT